MNGADMKKMVPLSSDFEKRLNQYVLLNMQDWFSDVQNDDNTNMKEKNKAKNLDEELSKPQYTFQEQLFNLIDNRNLTDIEVYKRAQIDRKLFSRIRCNRDYKPKKNTAIALIMALELDIYESEELLKLAGLALSPGVRSDLIIRFCIMNSMYDIDKVNEILDSYGEGIIGE